MEIPIDNYSRFTGAQPSSCWPMRRLLVATFTVIVPLNAAYQEYQLAGSIAALPAYSFATGQYRLYDHQIFWRKDFFAFEYDLDSFYFDYAYGLNDHLRVGSSAKTHLFDYQNLNHIVDSATGAERKSVALVAPYLRGNLFAEARWRSLYLRYLIGAQRYFLSPREDANRNLRVESPGTALTSQVALGYWQLEAPRPYAINGAALYLSTEAQYWSSLYVWEFQSQPLSAPRREVLIHELHARAGNEWAAGALRLMAAVRAGATNFSLPGESQDVIQSFSVGGPEARYRRIAGYAFSEFRAPTFALANLDAVVHAAGPVNLWLVADAALFDREYNSRRLHAGAGLGLVFDLTPNLLGNRSALFARAEIPFWAAGGNRFQIFLGLNGQMF